MPSLVNGLYEFGEFRLDAQKRTLQQGQELLALTPKAFDTLLVLIESRGQLVAKDELMKAVWSDSFVEESNLTQTIFMLRKALGQTRDQGYIVTVPGRGYRFVADVKPVSRTTPAEADVPSGSHAIGSSPGREKQFWQRLPVILAVAGGFLVVLAFAAYLKWSRPRPVSAERTMLAVLPFENFTGDPAQDYFSDGLTEEIISQLGNLDPAHLGVIAPTSVMHYKHSQEALRQIGEGVGGALCDRGKCATRFGPSAHYSITNPGQGPEPSVGTGIRSRFRPSVGTTSRNCARSCQRDRIQPERSTADRSSKASRRNCA